MKRSNRLLILIGFVLAACAFVGVVLLANGGGGLGSATAAPTPTPEPKTTVVVAAADIQLGDKITADKVKTKQVTITEKLTLGGADTFTTTDEVIGMLAGGSIAKDSVLHKGTDFLPPGTMVAGKSIAGSVATDMVAVGIEVDQVNGVGTLIVGGDHVDVVVALIWTELKIDGVTKNGSKISIGGNPAGTSKLVIQNRKVLTVLLPEPEAGTGIGAAASATPKKSGRTITNSGQHMTVILEVTPAEFEIIRYAQRHGEIDDGEYLTLGLALRSDKDNDKAPVTTTGINFSRLVQLYGVLPPDPRGLLPDDIGRGIQW